MTTNSKNGGPAFPIATTNDAIHVCDGMTLRDCFASMALAGLCANTDCTSLSPAALAKEAFRQADAMFAERLKGGAA